MLAMGVCGTVLVALGSTLGDLAKNFGGNDSSYYNYAYVYLNWRCYILLFSISNCHSDWDCVHSSRSRGCVWSHL